MSDAFAAEIERYQRAFETVNGERRYAISYRHGWIRFKGRSLGIGPVRIAKFREMTARLETQAKALALTGDTQ